MNKLEGESQEGLLGMALWLGKKAADTVLGTVDILPKGIGPGGHFSFAELSDIVIPYALKAVQSLLFDKQARLGLSSTPPTLWYIGTSQACGTPPLPLYNCLASSTRTVAALVCPYMPLES
jgi:hypothetical protein